MELQLSLALPAQAEAISQMARTIFRATYASYNPESRIAAYLAHHQEPHHFRAMMDDPAQLLLHATLAGETVGYAHLEPGQPEEAFVPDPAIELKRFYVAAAFHGKGVAAKLFEAVLAQVREREFQTLWLGVWELNHRAAAFYRKMGFQEAGTIPFQFEDDAQTDLLMIYPL